jgi:repressor of nif and glnA expression
MANGYRIRIEMSLKNQDIERKEYNILRVLETSDKALGSKIIARRLQDIGIAMGETTVRYHLKLLDERGLTRMVGRRDGRVITGHGLAELKHALVADKVGLALSKIETLAFRMDFDPDTRTGSVPVNISYFPGIVFRKALKIMKPVFDAGLCVSDLVMVAGEGEKIGETVVPAGMTAFATVCSIVFNGAMLRASIPVNSKFGGVLQLRDNMPVRFVELIHYTGSSMDPAEVFIRARMTSVDRVKKTGSGEILAGFREIPAVCQQMTEDIAKKLRGAGIGGILLMGSPSEPVCEIAVDVNRIGIVLIGGLNPVAAAQEAGLESENYAMGALVDYNNLVKFAEVYNERN